MASAFVLRLFWRLERLAQAVVDCHPNIDNIIPLSQVKMNFIFKMMDFVLKMMNFVFKMMDFVFKMINLTTSSL